MNFLKKKLKPLTSGLTSAATNITSNSQHPHSRSDKGEKDLEDDLYDEYVVEAPPHPSELLALGVDPTDIDVNDPDKLKELYRKAKEEGKDKKTNSVLLAKQRQKEEIEEKKKTREEWKFFDSITARVEQAVKDSQKTLQQLKESSAIDKLSEPEYELKLSADQVFKSSATVKQEKSANNWIDFSEEENSKRKEKEKEDQLKAAKNNSLTNNSELLDDFGCPRKGSQANSVKLESQNFIVEELLNDFGLDLRTADQKKASVAEKLSKSKQTKEEAEPTKRLDIDLKQAARPRPKPSTSQASGKEKSVKEEQVDDPFDTSFVAATVATDSLLLGPAVEDEKQVQESPTRALDPFDTSFINI